MGLRCQSTKPLATYQASKKSYNEAAMADHEEGEIIVGQDDKDARVSMLKSRYADIILKSIQSLAGASTNRRKFQHHYQEEESHPTNLVKLESPEEGEIIEYCCQDKKSRVDTNTIILKAKQSLNKAPKSTRRRADHGNQEKSHHPTNFTTIIKKTRSCQESKASQRPTTRISHHHQPSIFIKEKRVRNQHNDPEDDDQYHYDMIMKRKKRKQEIERQRETARIALNNMTKTIVDVFDDNLSVMAEFEKLIGAKAPLYYCKLDPSIESLIPKRIPDEKLDELRI